METSFIVQNAHHPITPNDDSVNEIARVTKDNFHLPDYKIKRIHDKMQLMQEEQDKDFFSKDPLKIFDPNGKLYESQMRLITRLHVMKKKGLIDEKYFTNTS
jgi:hypothetical protein